MKQFLKQKTLLLTTVAGMLYCPISAQADICSFLTGETSGTAYTLCEFAGNIIPEVALAGPDVVQPLPMTPSATTGSPSFGSILPDGSLKINQPGTLHIHSTLNTASPTTPASGGTVKHSLFIDGLPIGFTSQVTFPANTTELRSVTHHHHVVNVSANQIIQVVGSGTEGYRIAPSDPIVGESHGLAGRVTMHFMSDPIKKHKHKHKHSHS